MDTQTSERRQTGLLTILQTAKRRQIAFAMAVLAIYLMPLFILGEKAHIRVHDNLDSNLAWYKVLAESGQIFGPLEGIIPQIVNGGLSRNAFGPELSGIVWLHALLPTMAAYSLSQALARFLAFIGMYLLLKDHFIKESSRHWIIVVTALAFALTPFWPSGMLSTLGMPLALWAFLNIRTGDKRLANWMVLLLLPLYSSFVLGFFFFLAAMGLFWLVDAFKRKTLNLNLFFAIAVMTAMFLLVEYRLVYSFLFDDEPNSRDEYFHARLSFLQAARLSVKNFFLGHTHVMTVHGLFIMAATLIALWFVLSKKVWRKEWPFLLLLGINTLLSIWYAFWFYKGWLPLTEKFHFLDTFNFARFHFLRPMIIYIGFALALKILADAGIAWKKTGIFLSVCQLLLLLSFNDEIVYRNKPSVGEFYAKEQFADIARHIGEPKEGYGVASIGLHPAIAQYNGFYTLDTYNNFYPLTYKHEFRKIIEKELDKNGTIRTYFDEWGGRCYLFTAELGKSYMFKKSSKAALRNLELNTDQFKKMGGTYIFSAVPILNANSTGLKLEKVFDSDESAWRIYLYKAI
ncbi:hypothetical protein A8F94_06835 [Bacillus sp. FJAT-27225]|uniref:DUF6044 family protein n=1 Tax=Bacillus sp. FJAT-27225 TaxID=1743144 RepID=UPI00080C2199|nr:DUF6044 family protein [Bacillus sp. FJAT-27225]OCA87569.1 hypothetical protein A8F94_06835 [Bacillus sp. FJAT-27225]